MTLADQVTMKIETILKFCNPGQGAAEDRHLHRHLRSGREAVQKCIGEIDEIIGNFKAWERKTSDLFKALEEATGACYPSHRRFA